MNNSKLEISFMYSVPTCCTRIASSFKHGRYSSPKQCIYTAREVWPATGEFVVMSDVL